MFTAAQEIFAAALIVSATVLVALGKMPSADWQTMATWIFGIFVGGKTIQAGSAVITAATASSTTPAAAPAPAVAVAAPVVAPAVAS